MPGRDEETALDSDLLAAASVLTASLSSAALAAAQPVAPPAGAASGSHPTFSWILPANEEADIISIARRPDTTPTGEFFQENIVDLGILGAGQQTTWAPASALFAGPHWWNVRTHDRETFTSFYSTPSPFTVAPTIRLKQVRIRRNSFIYSPDELDFTLRWATNVRSVLVEARLFVRRNGRPVGRVRTTEETLRSMSEDTAFLTWRRPRRVKTGTRLRVLLSVVGGGRSAALTRVVRAP
jgi:hypothetical protein